MSKHRAAQVVMPDSVLEMFRQTLAARASELRREVAIAGETTRLYEVGDRADAAGEEILAGIAEAEIERDMQELRAV